ncbi:hypothetical protein DL96DRAFT_1576423 [Flagelloscypha sp. PMI_526]|nr:hypothetical protein DL96DRAFT_1576423 [Flagelloscypha sp. PMI_526]
MQAYDDLFQWPRSLTALRLRQRADVISSQILTLLRLFTPHSLHILIFSPFDPHSFAFFPYIFVTARHYKMPISSQLTTDTFGLSLTVGFPVVTTTPEAPFSQVPAVLSDTEIGEYISNVDSALSSTLTTNLHDVASSLTATSSIPFSSAANVTPSSTTSSLSVVTSPFTPPPDSQTSEGTPANPFLISYSGSTWRTLSIRLPGRAS